MTTNRTHYDALQTYFRIGEYPAELTMLKKLVFDSPHHSFNSSIPPTWKEVFGRHLGRKLQLPANNQAVAIEDDNSCVFLWNASQNSDLGIENIGYLQCQRINLNNSLILCTDDEEVRKQVTETLATLRISIAIDVGMINDLHFDPTRGPSGFEAGIVPFGYYIVDPETARMVYIRQNAELLNDFYGNHPKIKWQFIPEGKRPYFDDPYALRVLTDVVHALKQYAVLSL